MGLSRWLACVTALLTLLLACRAKSESLFVEEPCSDGTRWVGGTPFQYESGGPTDAPACTPHCGPNAPASGMWSGVGNGNNLTSAALPSGPCLHPGNTCTMAAEWLGPCAPGNVASGPLDLFICRCTDGQWACTVDATAPSATAWSCVPPL